jgi:hypothetical protein
MSCINCKCICENVKLPEDKPDPEDDIQFNEPHVYQNCSLNMQSITKDINVTGGNSNPWQTLKIHINFPLVYNLKLMRPEKTGASLLRWAKLPPNTENLFNIPMNVAYDAIPFINNKVLFSINQIFNSQYNPVIAPINNRITTSTFAGNDGYDNDTLRAADNYNIEQIIPNGTELVLNIRYIDKKHAEFNSNSSGDCNCIGKNGISSSYVINDNNNKIFLSLNGADFVRMPLINDKIHAIAYTLQISFNELITNYNVNFKGTVIGTNPPGDDDSIFLKFKITRLSGDAVNPNIVIRFPVAGIMGFPMGDIIFPPFDVYGVSFISNLNPFFRTFFGTIRIYKLLMSGVMHEFMHALGFVHTHQIKNNLIENNPIYQGNNPVDKIWNIDKLIDNILGDSLCGFNLCRWDVDQRNRQIPYIRANYIDRDYITPNAVWDDDSIMNYIIEGCWNINKIQTRKRYQLSIRDYQDISRIYGAVPFIQNITLQNNNTLINQSINYKSFYIIIIIIIVIVIVIVIILKHKY